MIIQISTVLSEIPWNILYQGDFAFIDIPRENKLSPCKYIILLSINLINGLESMDMAHNIVRQITCKYIKFNVFKNFFETFIENK